MSEKSRPNRAQGHLIVAAIRVLAHRETRPPNVEEIAELVLTPPELVRVAVRQLVELGVLTEVADAYDARLEVADYGVLEELAEGEGVAIRDELRTFSQKQREKQEGFAKQFEEDIASKQKAKFSKLEEDLKKFRGAKGPATNMWGEPVDEESE